MQLELQVLIGSQLFNSGLRITDIMSINYDTDPDRNSLVWVAYLLQLKLCFPELKVLPVFNLAEKHLSPYVLVYALRLPFDWPLSAPIEPHDAATHGHFVAQIFCE